MTPLPHPPLIFLSIFIQKPELPHFRLKPEPILTTFVLPTTCSTRLSIYFREQICQLPFHLYALALLDTVPFSVTKLLLHFIPKSDVPDIPYPPQCLHQQSQSNVSAASWYSENP